MTSLRAVRKGILPRRRRRRFRSTDAPSRAGRAFLCISGKTGPYGVGNPAARWLDARDVFHLRPGMALLQRQHLHCKPLSANASAAVIPAKTTNWQKELVRFGGSPNSASKPGRYFRSHGHQHRAQSETDAKQVIEQEVGGCPRRRPCSQIRR